MKTLLTILILILLASCSKEIEKPDGLNVFGNHYSKVAVKITDCGDVMMYEIAAQKTINDLVTVNWYSNNDSLYINSFNGNSHRFYSVRAKVVGGNAEWSGGYFKNIKQLTQF